MLGRIATLRERHEGLAPLLDGLQVDDDPRHVLLHASVVGLLERSDRLVGSEYDLLWRRLTGLIAGFPGTQDRAIKAAVYANMAGLIGLGDAEDYQMTAALARRFGHQRVAQLQDDLDDLLRLGPGLPLTTATVLQLARRTHIAHQVARAQPAVALDPAGPTDPEQIADRCYAAAFWLLMADIDPRGPATAPQSADELRILVEKHGAAQWRQVLAAVAANPWGPQVDRLHALAEVAGLPAPAQAIAWCAKVYRKRFEEAERLEVAKEIRRLVAISGCSQRQFAQYVGTSPSRLSTYVNGLVTPSAAMMLRISRAANGLAQIRAQT